MLRKHSPYYLLTPTLVVLLLATSAFALSGKRHKEIPHTTERELKVSMDAGFGDVNITKNNNGNILEATVESDKSLDMDDCIDYDIRDQVGFLDFSSNCNDNDSKRHSKHGDFNFTGFESSNWWLNVTDDVPVSFDLQLGVGKANLNMTGIAVKDLSLSAGASTVLLRFDEPNKSSIEDMSIEAGLSKFDGEGLCNSNFKNFKFEGGLGTYTLDFSGKLTHEVDANIEIGLGSVTIIVPKDIGVKVYCEKTWISHLSIDDDFNEKEDDTYYSPNYSSASGKINMHVEAGMGSVKIRRE